MLDVQMDLFDRPSCDRYTPAVRGSLRFGPEIDALDLKASVLGFNQEKPGSRGNFEETSPGSAFSETLDPATGGAAQVFLATEERVVVQRVLTALEELFGAVQSALSESTVRRGSA